MTKGPLGFGWMRLPVLSDDPTDIDFEEVNQMVDEFLDADSRTLIRVSSTITERAKMR